MALGLFVATVGYDAGVFRMTSALAVVLLGIVLVVPAAQARLGSRQAP